MAVGARTAGWCSVLVAVVATLLLVVAGCSAGNQQESSFTGPAPAGQAPLPESPPPDFAPQDDGVTEPDIVTTGSVRMTVADPIAAADQFVAATIEAGGRVQSRNDHSGTTNPSVDLTLRIPADKVDSVLADIDEMGVVESKSINADDVTAQRVDLDARIKALQTSVDRLLDLMSRATSTADLLAAETSLTERQAELDSIRAQRAALGDQIAYATISVDLASEPSVSRGGFMGAVHQGWRALVTVAVGFSQLIGFLLPWSPVLLVLGGAFFWLVRKAQRPSVSAPPASPQPTPEPADPPA